MRDQVTRLVTNGWSTALGDSIAAMNLYKDESATRRDAQIKRLVTAAGGNCRAEGPLWAENALRGEWKVACTNGNLRVRITLAPTTPARVQQFDVTEMRNDERIGALPTCRN
jgi:hypothetical protein